MTALLVAWISIVQPSLAVFWILRERQLTRLEGLINQSVADFRLASNSGTRADIPRPPLWADFVAKVIGAAAES
jgi:hypothetical protein